MHISESVIARVQFTVHTKTTNVNSFCTHYHYGETLPESVSLSLRFVAKG